MSDEEKRKRIVEEARAHIDQSWSPERFPPRTATQPSAPMRRTDRPSDLVFKTNENAHAPAAELPDQPHEAVNAWDAWLDRRLDERLAAYTDGCVEFLKE